MPAGQGLFGGATPYPVSPQVQQGLMGDAWRQFGVALMSQAQNPNLTQGLAGALQAGRQAYAGGAEQAYQVGREQEQDKQYQEYRQAQIQASEALAEQRRQDAERERREAGEAAESAQQQADRVAGVLAELERSDPERARGLRQIIALSGGKIPAAVLGELLPQEEAAMTPYQQEQVRLAEERLNLQRRRADRPAEAADEPGGLSPTKIAQMLASNMAMLDRRARENPTYDRAGNPIVPPPHVIRAQAEELLRQQIAAVGRATGAPQAPVANPESVFEAAGVPPEARTPEAIKWVREQLATRTPEEIIEELSGGR